MYQVQEAFEKQKEEENRQQEIFNKKEEELRARDLAVQEKFLEFSKVINDNDAKLQRAKNRIEDEKKAIENRQKKKQELEEKLNEYKSKAQELEEKSFSMKKYEEFLESVRAKNPEEFSDISDILGLYSKLTSANKQLKNQQKELEEENQRIRSQSDKVEKKKKEEVLQLNIEIAQLSKEHEEIDSKRQELSKQVEQSNLAATEKNVEIGHIMMAIDNLYRKCLEGPKINHSKNFKPLTQEKKEDVNLKSAEAMQKLKIIRSYLIDYKTMIEDCPRRLLAESQTAKHVFKNMLREFNT